MDLRKVKKLIELVQESGISELEVRSGDEQIRISRAGPVVPGAPVMPPVETPDEPVPDKRKRGEVVDAPLAGTFYRAPAPGEKPFVEIGDTVAAGDVLCIIESMKMMNRIESERAGEIVEVLVDNGKPIESGTALFRIV